MDINRDSVNKWLADMHRSQVWLADQCGVSKQAVSNWLREKNPQQISASAQITIRSLMEEDAVAQQAKPPHNLVLEFSDSEYAPIERAALKAGMTIREWVKTTLNDIVDMDVERFIEGLHTVSDSLLTFPEIPLHHAAAGLPASSDVEYFAPTKDLGKGRFACKLHGESMSPKFPDGSTVILRERGSLKNPTLKKGEIYLFVVNGEKTLKVYNTRVAKKAEIEAGISYVSVIDGKTKVKVLQSINPDFPEIVAKEPIEWLGWLDKDDQ
ncbi:LexA family transcriptional regulator [Luteolibacter pohnpeiensis]|uniref:LexA family transcriptional regulator n=1 Tax=Luteolibacter pohnpeiensis TaxID=454153 RepID=A0A934S6V1_9BACT|nr:LexA family transcriptional regulator [Luteolibacter pohnpeiensis]MBK1884170.1 LexA family transcriptional regulator [Luteolibacter pohnpeiensis]